jgi:hypothetical protein
LRRFKVVGGNSSLPAAIQPCPPPGNLESRQDKLILRRDNVARRQIRLTGLRQRYPAADKLAPPPITPKDLQTTL